MSFIANLRQCALYVLINGHGTFCSHKVQLEVLAKLVLNRISIAIDDAHSFTTKKKGELGSKIMNNYLLKHRVYYLG